VLPEQQTTLPDGYSTLKSPEANVLASGLKPPIRSPHCLNKKASNRQNAKPSDMIS